MSFLGRNRQMPDYDCSVLASYMGKRICIKDHEFFNGLVVKINGWRNTHFRCFRVQLQDGSVQWLLPQEVEVLP